MTPARAVLVSILNWNTAGMTVDCVASVLQLQRGATLKLDIVVIDNASRPDDWQRLQAGIDPAQVTLLRQERNLGFEGGHNVAVRMRSTMARIMSGWSTAMRCSSPIPC